MKPNTVGALQDQEGLLGGKTPPADIMEEEGHQVPILLSKRLDLPRNKRCLPCVFACVHAMNYPGRLFPDLCCIITFSEGMIGCREGCTVHLSRSWTVNWLVWSVPGLKASDSTIGCNRQIGPVCPPHLRTIILIERNGAPFGRCNYS